MEPILLFYLTILTSVNSISFQPATRESGVLFTELSTTYTYYDRWHLCYYFDLGQYYDQIDKLETCISQMIDICGTMRDKNLCAVLEDVFETDFRRIRLGTDALRKIYGRERRAPFEFMGRFANMAFGIMDADTARDYDQKINELQSEAETNGILSKDKTSLIEGVIRLNNKTFTDFKEKIIGLEDETQSIIYRLNISDNHMITEGRLRDIVSIATLILIDHTKLATQIEDILDESIQGKLSGLIPINNLENDFAQIQMKLGRNQILPTNLGHNGIHNVGKFISTKATLFEKRIFIEIGIPVVENDQYVLYKAIPVPARLHGQLVVMSPASKYFLLSLQGASYIPLSDSDIQACLHLNGETLICNPYAPLHHNMHRVCELAIFTNQTEDLINEICTFKIIPTSNYFIQINHQDKYYISIDAPIEILNSCDNRPVEVTKIRKSGILSMEPGCMVSTDDIRIRSHNHKYFNDTKIISPHNGIQNLKFDKMTGQTFTAHSIRKTVLIRNYEDDFNQLAETADNILERETTRGRFERIHYDNTTHSYAIFIIIAIIVALSAVIGFIIYKRVNPLSSLLSLITGIQPATDPDGTTRNDRQIVINFEGHHTPENNTGIVN